MMFIKGIRALGLEKRLVEKEPRLHMAFNRPTIDKLDVDSSLELDGINLKVPLPKKKIKSRSKGSLKTKSQSREGSVEKERKSNRGSQE